MTPRELALALRGAAGLPGSQVPLARTDLAALMQTFPDHPLTPEKPAQAQKDNAP